MNHGHLVCSSDWNGLLSTVQVAEQRMFGGEILCLAANFRFDIQGMRGDPGPDQLKEGQLLRECSATKDLLNLVQLAE